MLRQTGLEVFFSPSASDDPLDPAASPPPPPSLLSPTAASAAANGGGGNNGNGSEAAGGGAGGKPRSILLAFRSSQVGTFITQAQAVCTKCTTGL